jgi:glycosyltransferase involved in cell wall biosynthesis
VRVLFDAYWWVEGPTANRAVLREVVHAWREQFPEDTIALAVRKQDVDTIRAAMPSVGLLPLRFRPHGLSVIFELPFRALKARPDIMITNNFTPLFGPSAVFIQDVLFETNPEWFTVPERAYFRLMPLSAARARVVYSSSRAEGRRIRSIVKSARRVKSVGLAVGVELLAEKPITPSAPLTPKGFILTVGRLNVRKNLEFTCLAAIRSGRLSPEYPLVIAGSFQGKTTVISAEMESAVARGDILLLGFVSASELVWLYENAAAFLFMSLGEGFGLPPLEALSFGSQVIASDIPVMREILGVHATFVDPTSVDELGYAIAQLELDGDDATRREYARTSFSWPSTVRQMRSALTTPDGLPEGN